jgi:hypothetical protein
MTVESVAPAGADPPPDTPTVLISGELASIAMFTVTEIVGYVAPGASTSAREHEPTPHVHPLPLIETRVMPAGGVSVTVTVPVLGPANAELLTVTV